MLKGTLSSSNTFLTLYFPQIDLFASFVLPLKVINVVNSSVYLWKMHLFSELLYDEKVASSLTYHNTVMKH